MRRKRFKLKPNQTTFALNITSLTDMFTILLVFLLQTYSTSDVQIIPEKDISLPISNVETNPVKAPSISISRTELKIEGRTIASLTDGNFRSQDLEGHDSNFIRPLFSELQALAKAQSKDLSKDGAVQKDASKGLAEGVAKDGKIFLQADSSLSYQLIRKVMYTASMAGYPQLKLATVVGN